MKRPGGFDGLAAEPEIPEPRGAEPRESGSRSAEPRESGSRGRGLLGRAPRRAADSGAGSSAAPSADPPSILPEDPPARPVELPAERPVELPVERRDDAPEDPVRAAKAALRRAQRSVRRRERREQKRFTAHLRRRRRYWLAGGGAVLALALFVAVGAFSPLTAVNEVRITGASRVDLGDLQEALGRFDGVPLALVSEQEVHRALEPFPLIQRYSVERIPPHTLVVRIEERDPVIAVGRDGAFKLLDPAGVLVANVEERPKGVPLAEGASADPSSAGFAAAGRVIRDLPQSLRDRLAGVAATSAQDVEFTLTDGTRVIWGEAAETQRKAVVLQAMLQAMKSAQLIDVSAPDAPVFT